MGQLGKLASTADRHSAHRISIVSQASGVNGAENRHELRSNSPCALTRGREELLLDFLRQRLDLVGRGEEKETRGHKGGRESTKNVNMYLIFGHLCFALVLLPLLVGPVKVK